jgi:RNA polymerase sigma-70 factor (ECF subfamily)
MNKKNLDIALLLTKFRKGDERAFSDLYDLFVDKLYRYLLFKIEEQAIDDIIEVTFLKAWENRLSFDETKSSFLTWLIVIARNSVIDYYRTKKETLNIDDFAEPYREILVLRYFEDLDYQEIAKLVDKNENAVRVINFRGLKKLKQLLHDLAIDL